MACPSHVQARATLCVAKICPSSCVDAQLSPWASSRLLTSSAWRQAFPSRRHIQSVTQASGHQCATHYWRKQKILNADTESHCRLRIWNPNSRGVFGLETSKCWTDPTRRGSDKNSLPGKANSWSSLFFGGSCLPIDQGSGISRKRGFSKGSVARSWQTCVGGCRSKSWECSRDPWHLSPFSTVFHIDRCWFPRGDLDILVYVTQVSGESRSGQDIRACLRIGKLTRSSSNRVSNRDV